MKTAIEDKLLRTEAEFAIRYEFFDKEDESNSGYRQIEREIGSGPLRIGTVLDLGDDVYSLLLASHLKKDIVDKHKCDAYLKGKATDKLCNDHCKLLEDKKRKKFLVPDDPEPIPQEEIDWGKDDEYYKFYDKIELDEG